MKLTLDKHWHAVREAHAKWDEAYPKWLEARAKWDEAYATWVEAHAKWYEAVHKTCGPNASIKWLDEGCMVLGVMLFLY